MVLEHIGYIVQDLFGKGFKKLVPLGKDSKTPNLGHGEVRAIADNPEYWTAEKLADNYHKFHNIGTIFGPQLLADGSVAYSHCLDIDSEAVRAAIEPYLQELMKLTYIVVTRKGLHVHWLEHTQHERIGNSTSGRSVRRCIAGCDFELKTDHAGGLAHLPTSFHRDDVKEKNPNPFRYHKLEGCADKVGLIDNFMGSGLGLYDFLLQESILGQYVKEANDNSDGSSTTTRKRRSSRRSRGAQKSEDSVRDGDTVGSSDTRLSSDDDAGSTEASEIETTSPHVVEDVEEEEEPEEVAASTAGTIDAEAVIAESLSNLYFICADRIYGLVEKWYVKDHRNNLMLCITGAIRRSWSDISLEDAEHIITEFCKNAGDEELNVRLNTLRSTYDKDDPGEVAGFGPFSDILSKLEPDLSTDKHNQTIKNVRAGVYAALDDFKANSILLLHPNIEIGRSKRRYIVSFDHTVEEVEFPQVTNPVLQETIRSVERKALLLNAGPTPPLKEVWDPIYGQTKYKVAFRSLGNAGRITKKEPDKLMTVDELEEWLRVNGSYYHRPGRLGEVIHAIVDAHTKAGLVDYSIGTDIEGLVFLPMVQQPDQVRLVLSNMKRPPMPTKEQALACIKLTRDVKTRFYSGSKLETDRYAHFLKIGTVAPVDFPRRQSGAVNTHDIIPRQDLGGFSETGKSFGFAAIPLRMYRLPLNKGVGHHSYIVGSGSVDSAPRFIEQTRWTTFAVVFDEADRYSEWEEDREARRILSILKNSTTLTNPRDTLTSDSEQVTKPSAAYVILTHNSPLILEDGFSRRCIGHEFTINDTKTPGQKDTFNEFWKVPDHIQTFGYLGDFILNYYLDHPEVLNNTWLDIAKIILRSFWVDAGGLSEAEFENEWDSWLGNVVSSATSKDGLVEVRTANIIAMFRSMINDAWARNRQPAAIWIAKNIDKKISAGELDYNSGAARAAIDDAIVTATFAEKFEALLKTDNLTHLVYHPKHGVTMDSSIVDEMQNRYNVSRVTHKALADLLGFEFGPIRFGSNGVKKTVYTTIDQFVQKIAPRSESLLVDGV